MTRLDREARVAIEALVSHGTSKAAEARLLGVSESTVRYHAGRMSAGALDGRGDKAFKAAPLAEAIGHWREAQADAAINLAGLHEWLRLLITIAASLPLEYVRRRSRGEERAVRLLIRGYLDGLLGREPPYRALGLR